MTLRHRIIQFPNGTASVQPIPPKGRESFLVEAMHSQIGPWEEALALYIEPSGLKQKLSEPEQAPLILFDVGMGIAANALAAIEAWNLTASEGLPVRDLEIHSFEAFLDGIELALAHCSQFPFLARHESTLHALLKTRSWASAPTAAGKRIRWTLWEGPFQETDLNALPSPDLIYYDFYSPKQCPELWGVEIFGKLGSHARLNTRGCSLFTYVSATSARAALLLSGWNVGTGLGTSMKAESTHASTQLEHLAAPLGARWIEKWKRSDKPLPLDWAPRTREQAIAALQITKREGVLFDKNFG